MPQLAHHVYFTLKDRSDEAVQTLLDACNKYLDNHEGLVGFSIGTRDRELDREVNQDFDVSLHCIFADRAAHDVYQTAERHLQFIEENKDSWAGVRVLDSLIQDA
ncbi:Dabb family protein [Rubripirellula sp.]|nr:Dabb family protein [Rubripirellula sp.]MDB4749763.1 Dabb family protein [Rubripirellula sp.]